MDLTFEQFVSHKRKGYLHESGDITEEQTDYSAREVIWYKDLNSTEDLGYITLGGNPYSNAGFLGYFDVYRQKDEATPEISLYRSYLYWQDAKRKRKQ